MDRALAHIERIRSIEPIEGADRIEKSTILGWEVVIRKEEFKVGDLVVYIEIDSILPEREEFEFLRDRKFRIKTVRLRGQVSQGIAFPLSILPDGIQIEEGLDVTEALNIHKYEPPIPAQLSGVVKGAFPSFIPKTDETRIQSVPDVLVRHKGKVFFISEKLDGCLDEDTKLETTDGSKTINEICNTNYKGSVKSYDIEGDKVVWDKIEAHSVLENNHDWYELELADGQTIKLTGNHQVWLPILGCWREVSDLRGDEILLVD
ncbi:TPA: hypothetical protein EYP66_11855 [Candidatus Poribacteria bacterium]|nr:hypothetical protein [Candidatus Poribacteria bacterium]